MLEQGIKISQAPSVGSRNTLPYILFSCKSTGFVQLLLFYKMHILSEKYENNTVCDAIFKFSVHFGTSYTSAEKKEQHSPKRTCC